MYARVFVALVRTGAPLLCLLHAGLSQLAGGTVEVERTKHLYQADEFFGLGIKGVAGAWRLAELIASPRVALGKFSADGTLVYKTAVQVHLGLEIKITQVLLDAVMGLL